MTDTPPRPRSNLLRAMALGLSLGAIIGGLALLFAGGRARAGDVDCAKLSPSECTLEVELRSQLSRTQIGMGAGLSLLGIGGLLWQSIEDRRRRRPPQEA